MEKAMRRKDRAVSQEEALEALRQGEYGILSTIGPEGEPYGVPLSYAFMDGVLYFHCAREGRKLNNLAHCGKVSFCAVTGVKPVFDGGFSTYFNSVIVSGRTEEVVEEAEKTRALLGLAAKYLPGDMDKADENIKRSSSRTAVYKIVPEHISGKAKKPKDAR